MELARLQALLPEYEKLKAAIAAEQTTKPFDTYAKQYDPSKHDITDTGKRPNKTIETDKGTKVEDVARLSIPMQELIVSRAAAFLCGNPVELEYNSEDKTELELLDMIQKVWDDNKLDYESKKLAKLMMSETEVAELWYTEEADPEYWNNTPNQGSKFRLRMRVLANSLGDTLHPVYNNAGDMIAFGRGYKIKDEEGKIIECYDLYTDTLVYKGIKRDSWAVTPETHTARKIPIIYYSQPEPEWLKVQNLIDRIEKLISNHAENNDYYGHPIMTVEGKINGFASKGENGKILELDPGAKVNMLTWPQAPESVKLEYNSLRSLIFDLTDTPDISLEQMKALGTYSGIALKMLFLGAHLKASDKEEIFGKGIQRRINYLKSALAYVVNVRLEKGLSLTIKPKFEYYLPKNDSERIDMLSTATGGKPIMSVKTALNLNPLISDPEAEEGNLRDEKEGTLGDQF